MRVVDFEMDIHQSKPASCAIKCQQLILRDYGIWVSEQELLEIAYRYGLCDICGGTHMSNNGKILNGFGISFHHSQNNKIANILSELNKNHRVIVNVNRLKLYGQEVLGDYAYHALIVTDVDKEYVYVINPSTGAYDEMHKVYIFNSAWSDSCHYMLATDEPALYKCDYSSKQVIVI